MLYKNHSAESRVWPYIRRLNGPTLELAPGEEIDSEDLEFLRPHSESGFDDAHLKPVDWTPPVQEEQLIETSSASEIADDDPSLLPANLLNEDTIGHADEDEPDTDTHTDDEDEEPQA